MTQTNEVAVPEILVNPPQPVTVLYQGQRAIGYLYGADDASIDEIFISLIEEACELSKGYAIKFRNRKEAEQWQDDNIHLDSIYYYRLEPVFPFRLNRGAFRILHARTYGGPWTPFAFHLSRSGDVVHYQIMLKTRKEIFELAIYGQFEAHAQFDDYNLEEKIIGIVEKYLEGTCDPSVRMFAPPYGPN